MHWILAFTITFGTPAVPTTYELTFTGPGACSAAKILVDEHYNVNSLCSSEYSANYKHKRNTTNER